MGASVSTNKSSIENNMLQSAYNSCGTVGSYNVTDLSGIQFLPPPECGSNSSFTIGQTATVDAKCLLTSLQKSAANVATKLSAQAQAGLGFAVSTNISDTVNNISQYSKNKCSNVSASNQASIKDTIIKACTFRVVQNANANQSCQINATQDAISNIATNEAANAKGASIWSLLFGSGGYGKIILIMILVIAIAVAALILVKHFTGKKGKKSTSGKHKTGKHKHKSSSIKITDLDSDLGQTGGLMSLFNSMNDPQAFMNNLKKNNSYTILVIVIIVILVIFLYNLFKNKDNKLTENDIQNIYQTINQEPQSTY